MRVLDAAELGAAQQRLRAYLVCALDAAVLAAFSWPSPTHKRRSATLPPSPPSVRVCVCGSWLVAKNPFGGVVQVTSDQDARG